MECFKIYPDEPSEQNIDLNNKPENSTDADKWILSKINTLTKDVTENLDKYELV
ncbi:MAG: hypothetical protein ACLT2Z_00890 [Eubacterium sp.]